MDEKGTEACGRCSVSTVIDAAGSGRDASADEEGTDRRNPFDGERIEVQEDELQSVVRHEVLAHRLKRRLDALATRLIYH